MILKNTNRNSLDARVDKIRGIASGMDDFITKPVRLEQLEIILKRWYRSYPASPNSS
jgi:DNA-binding response OmpR family regulator